MVATSWLEMIGQDARIALRTLRRNPGFAITAAATLALAIGANTAMFSLISFTLLEPLPYPDAERIMQFWFTTPGGSGLTLSIPEVNTLARETALFEDVAAYDFGGPGVNITGAGEPEQVKAIHVSAAYFRLFGSATNRIRWPASWRLIFVPILLHRCGFHSKPIQTAPVRPTTFARPAVSGGVLLPGRRMRV